MAGSRATTASYVLKKALFDTATGLWVSAQPEFEVVWGRIVRWPDKYVQFVGVGAEQEVATMSPNRSREETVQLEAEWYVLIRGQVDAARDAEEYLFDRIGELEYQLRHVDPTVGGVARHCFLTRSALDTVQVKQNNFQGHMAVALTTFEGKVRITG